MLLKRSAIAMLVPHAGSMVLLDGVIGWTAETLQAKASSHRAGDNPLRRADRLSILTGIEYAAQATAVHGALLTSRPGGCAEERGASVAADEPPDGGVPPTANLHPRRGFLAMVRDIRWTCDRLDTVAADLDIHVHLVTAQAESTLYDFRLAAAGAELLSGRLAVFFPEGTTNP